MHSSPTRRSASASANFGSNTSQADGAPSFPCFGACSRLVTVELTYPIGSSVNTMVVSAARSARHGGPASRMQCAGNSAVAAPCPPAKCAAAWRARWAGHRRKRRAPWPAIRCRYRPLTARRSISTRPRRIRSRISGSSFTNLARPSRGRPCARSLLRGRFSNAFETRYNSDLW